MEAVQAAPVTALDVPGYAAALGRVAQFDLDHPPAWIDIIALIAERDCAQAVGDLLPRIETIIDPESQPRNRVAMTRIWPISGSGAVASACDALSAEGAPETLPGAVNKLSRSSCCG